MSDGKYKVVFIKGAPERIIAMCDRAPPVPTAIGDNPVPEVSAFAKYWTDGANKAAARGMRVLAVGYKIIAADLEFKGHLPLYCGCILTALIGETRCCSYREKLFH
jgi:magnesium-transporting ATPase (P-type)